MPAILLILPLAELRPAALDERTDADPGAPHDLVGEVEALIVDHPLRERVRAQLMLALYRSGRQTAAQHAYRAARRELADQLGLEPGARFRWLLTGARS